VIKLDLAQQLAETFALDEPNEQARWRALLNEWVQSAQAGSSCLRDLKPATRAFLKGVKWVDEQGAQPFVLDAHGFYLQRDWAHEVQLVARIKALQVAKRCDLGVDLAPIFADAHQREAAKKALSQRLTLITGGPGTGKTTTVLKIVALHLMAQPDLKIVLAAPTGKAAARLSESMVAGLGDARLVRPHFSEAILAQVPTQATTLHRLLGSIPFSPRFRHHAGRPLQADLVVVDEASMIDLALMNRLVQSLKPTASLILLGDPDQLASVESGQVLADLRSALPECWAHLQTVFRFEGAIAAMAQAVNRGDESATLDCLRDGTGVQFCEGAPLAWAKKAYAPYLALVQQNAPRSAIFAAFQEFRVLCATRADKARFDALIPSNALWYPGRPVMILANHPEQGLFNGDVGLCLLNEQGQLRVYFETTQEARGYVPERLPAHETAFSMTVHKSQGSEFGEVLIVLPGEDEGGEEAHRVLSRQWLYTALTRAKKRVILCGSEARIGQCVRTPIARETGLAERLSRF